jgi:hypothetical protein
MREHEISIHIENIENNQVIVARKPCSELYDKLGTIEFILQGTQIYIKPRGYLYSLPNQETDCFIGI